MYHMKLQTEILWFTYIPVPRTSICNGRVEDGSIANQESVDTCCTKDEVRHRISLDHLEYVWHTFSLNNCRNSKSGVVKEIVLAPLDIIRDPIPSHRISNWLFVSNAPTPTYRSRYEVPEDSYHRTCPPSSPCWPPVRYSWIHPRWSSSNSWYHLLTTISASGNSRRRGKSGKFLNM